ncbi:hypothetical protein R3P38DRAFT_2512595 [Favolaschia claudopus]|uniref:Alpha-type protein kinase domain-containing protein n=2 Tax=Favolaschia claudopus TaxID=2862362 RepID=A0AAW0CR11_9AGAR
MGPPTGIPQPFGSFAGWNPAPPSGNMMPPHQPVSMSGPRYSSAQGPGSMTSLLGGLTPAPGALVPVYSAAARPSASSTPVAGYSASHLYYRSDQERRAKQAFASPYKGSVEFRLCVMPENKTVAKLVGSVLECIKEVPAHIGHADLLETGMRAITHEWRRFAGEYPLSSADVVMRDEKWCLLIPKNPDVDIISDRFYVAPKKPNMAPQFRTRKIIINLHLPNEIHNAVLIYREEQHESEDRALVASVEKSIASNSHEPVTAPAATVRAAPKGKGKSKSKGKGKAEGKGKGKEVEDSAIDQSVSVGYTLINSDGEEQGFPLLLGASSSSSSMIQSKRPITPPRPSTKRPLPESPGSPEVSREDMMRLVKRQTYSSKSELGAFLGQVSMVVVVHPMRLMSSLDELRDLDSGDWQNLCTSSQAATLILHTDSRRQMIGAFKIASFGSVSPGIFRLAPESGHAVCAKQSYYKSTAKVGGMSLVQHVPHDFQRQGKTLTMELRCLLWAHVLHSAVYGFTRRFLRENNKELPFTLPWMRFVHGALASSTGASTVPTLYLLEEVIDQSKEGAFRKYINNASAAVLDLKNPEDRHRAEFLAFCQHYQLIKTHGTLFVSDYQGGESLLTDPQIMSSPSLDSRQLFADGNIGKGFESFQNDHVCNKFCEFFELQRDFDLKTNVEGEDSDGVKSMAISVAE